LYFAIFPFHAAVIARDAKPAAPPGSFCVARQKRLRQEAGG
jgi:hypothetical protein